jgi:hypothetical protein
MKSGRGLVAIIVATLALSAGAQAAVTQETSSTSSEEIACVGDACQPLPPPPVDPTLTTTVHGAGNPAVHYVDHTKCRAGFVRRGGKCVRRHARHRHSHRTAR